MFTKDESEKRIPKPVKVLLFVGFIALAVFAIGNVITYLWNEILVELTAVKPINFWQSIGLFILSRILFGGFRWGGQHRAHWKKKKAKWREKWSNMSDEERETFKQKWRERCKTKNKSTDEEST